MLSSGRSRKVGREMSTQRTPTMCQPLTCIYDSCKDIVRDNSKDEKKRSHRLRNIKQRKPRPGGRLS